MSLAIAVELVRLSELRPPPQHVLGVSQTSPIEGFLEDGTPVTVTAVLDRTAIFERPGRDLSEGREQVRKQWLRVDPAGVTWKRETARRGGRQQVHKCHTCKRPGGKTRFASPESLNCLSCEGKA